MQKLFILLAAVMISAGAMAQGHHNKRPHGQHDNHRRPPVEQYHIECATPEQMQIVLQTLKNEPFDDKKLEIAKLCVTIAYFCTDDMAQMAKLFSFDDNRLKFLKYAYPYCLDKENYPRLAPCFEFSNNFNELLDYIYQR